MSIESHVSTAVFEAASAQALKIVELTRTLTPADMERPTPCKGWMVRDILAHTTSGGERINGYLRAVLEDRPTEAFSLADTAAINQRGVDSCRDDPDLVRHFGEVVDEGLRLFGEIEAGGLGDRPFMFFAVMTPTELAASLAADLATHQWDYGQALKRPQPPDASILAKTLPSMLEQILPKTFLPEKAGTLVCSYGIKLTDVQAGEWIIDINGGQIAVRRESIAPARVKTITDAGTFVLLSYGRLNPILQMLRGRVKSHGNPLLAMKFGSLFQKA
ncbi:MAG TPA: maleylpyruvate isomerase family mycothiol-dependent enzyme [Chloroflexota bacterium]|nr:maleylpyruvate isomerase family mycothiol-dependent enzyme [Chloroflexota bacterium]